MKHFLFLVLLLSTIVLKAQSTSFEISGTLISRDDKFPLESATVYLERETDSTLVTYDISDSDGAFTLEGRSSDRNLKLYISYIGFKKYAQVIRTGESEINLGAIALETDDNILDEVVIKSTAPITIKKDTLQFNAASFKTKKDATVEDLLKELPGVELDDDGVLLINGKPIDKILVNGKPFFGDDPTITLRNLTKDIINTLQITDTKTKAQAFAGEEGDKTSKTLNLVIRKEHNKGDFGRVAAGVGTNKRYEYAGMYNHFDNDQRMSVLAGGNNINSPGFSFGEIKKMFSGTGVNASSFGAGDGIVKSNNIGVNYADEFGDKVDADGNYFYSGSESENKSENNREYILADRRYFTNSNSNSSNTNNNHRANLGFEIKVDSTLLINVDPSFKYIKNEQTISRSSTSLNEDETLINQSNSTSLETEDRKNFSNNISATKRLGSKGSFLKLNISNEINTVEADDLLNSETDIFGDTPNSIIRKQDVIGENKSNNNAISATYRLPIKTKEMFLDFRHSFRKNKSENIKSTFDFDEDAQAYIDFNEDLSKSFEYINKTHVSALKLIYRKEKWSTSFQTQYVIKDLENIDLLRPQFSLKRDFKNLELRYRFDFRFNAKSNVSFDYDLTNNEPSLARLQEFEDASNPLNIVVGNPNLEVSNNHRIKINYKTFNFQKKIGFYTYLNMNFDNNEDVSKVTIDEDLVKYTTFENVNGNYSINGRVSFRKEINIDDYRTFKFGVGVGSNIRRRINYNNDVKYASLVKAVSPGFGLRFRWKDVLEINPNYTLSVTNTTYDLDSFDENNFLFHSMNIRTDTYLPKNFEWRNDVAFSYDPSIADGFQKSAWFWNTTLSYALLKDSGLVTLKVYDLLNQNTNARHRVTQDYIEDSFSTVLQQYFMLSFSWKFNNLGKAGEV